MKFRLVVVSDTHLPRFAHGLERVLGLVRAERPDLIVHCGDFTEPEAIAPFEAIAAFDGVAGNNDGEQLVRRFGLAKVREVGPFSIGFVHGHGGRGTTEQRARSAFRDRSPSAILFGHSHVPLCERRDGVWLINPGSPTDKRRQPRYSYATIDIEEDRFEPRLVFFD